MDNVHVQIKKLVDEVWDDDSKFDKNYKEIIKLLKKELKSKPNDIVTLTNLGSAYCDIGKHKEAKKILNKAIELGSNDRNTYFNFGVVLMNTENRDEAKKYFNLASKLKENELTFEAYIDFHGY